MIYLLYVVLKDVWKPLDVHLFMINNMQEDQHPQCLNQAEVGCQIAMGKVMDSRGIIRGMLVTIRDNEV